MKILLLIALAWAGEKPICLEKGQIKYFSRGEAKIEKNSYCYNSHTFLSISCKKNRKCLALKAISSKKLTIDTTIGREAFKLCRAFRGIPTIGEYQNKLQKWVPVSYCTFKDRSFINVDSLYLRNQRIQLP